MLRVNLRTLRQGTQGKQEPRGVFFCGIPSTALRAGKPRASTQLGWRTAQIVKERSGAARAPTTAKATMRWAACREAWQASYRAVTTVTRNMHDHEFKLAQKKIEIIKKVLWTAVGMISRFLEGDAGGRNRRERSAIDELEGTDRIVCVTQKK